MEHQNLTNPSVYIVVTQEEAAKVQDRQNLKNLTRQVSKDVAFHALLITYFTLSYIAPSISGTERRSDCPSGLSQASARFAWSFSTTLLTWSMVLLLVIRNTPLDTPSTNRSGQSLLRERMDAYVLWEIFVKFLVCVLGFTVYFIWSTVAIWPKLKGKSDCISSGGIQTLDFINWCITLAMSFIPAIVTSLGLVVGICTLPFTYKEVSGLRSIAAMIVLIWQPWWLGFFNLRFFPGQIWSQRSCMLCK